MFGLDFCVATFSRDFLVLPWRLLWTTWDTTAACSIKKKVLEFILATISLKKRRKLYYIMRFYISSRTSLSFHNFLRNYCVCASLPETEIEKCNEIENRIYVFLLKHLMVIYKPWRRKLRLRLKFIYSEKTTNFCEIFTLLLSYVVPVKSKVKILAAFSEYMNFTSQSSNKSKEDNPKNEDRWSCFDFAAFAVNHDLPRSRK